MYSIKELKLKVVHKVVWAALLLDSIPCAFVRPQVTPGLPKWLEIKPTLLKMHLNCLRYFSNKKWNTRLVLLKVVNTEGLLRDLGGHDHLFQGNKRYFQDSNGTYMYCPQKHITASVTLYLVLISKIPPFSTLFLICTLGSKRAWRW